MKPNGPEMCLTDYALSVVRMRTSAIGQSQSQTGSRNATRRASRVLHETAVARNVETHVVGVSSAHAHASLSKLNEEIIGNFKMTAAER